MPQQFSQDKRATRTIAATASVIGALGAVTSSSPTLVSGQSTSNTCHQGKCQAHTNRVYHRFKKNYVADVGTADAGALVFDGWLAPLKGYTRPSDGMRIYGACETYARPTAGQSGLQRPYCSNTDNSQHELAAKTEYSFLPPSVWQWNY